MVCGVVCLLTIRLPPRFTRSSPAAASYVSKRQLAHLLLLHKHSRLTHIEGRRGEEVVEGDAEAEAEGEHEPAAIGLTDAPQVGERYEIFCAVSACIFCVHALISSNQYLYRWLNMTKTFKTA